MSQVANIMIMQGLPKACFRNPAFSLLYSYITNDLLRKVKSTVELHACRSCFAI